MQCAHMPPVATVYLMHITHPECNACALYFLFQEVPLDQRIQKKYPDYKLHVYGEGYDKHFYTFIKMLN
jgi:hypothetical protein